MMFPELFRELPDYQPYDWKKMGYLSKIQEEIEYGLHLKYNFFSPKRKVFELRANPIIIHRVEEELDSMFRSLILNPQSNSNITIKQIVLSNGHLLILIPDRNIDVSVGYFITEKK